MTFEPNEGQFQSDTGFVVRGQNYHAKFAAQTPTLEIKEKYAAEPLRMRFKGAKTVAPHGVNQLPGYSNYFLGRDRRYWRAGVAQYERIRYSDIYAGVDLDFYSRNGQLEYDLIFAAGANPQAIALSFENAKDVRVDDQGELSIAYGDGEFRHHKPIAYQESSGRREMVESRFSITQEGEVGFVLGAYDRQRTLVIDPAISYSALLGGSSNDNAQSIAVDATGNAYIAGSTTSDDFTLTPSAYRTSAIGAEVFIAKINPTGTSLLYATYLGGSGFDRALSLAVDAAGNAYVTGSTASPDFPITMGVLRNSFVNGEAFVTKLNSTGSALLYSTFLGGNGNEIAYSMAVDATGNAYVTGLTSSNNFPITLNALKGNIGGVFDAFVTKLNPSASTAVYSTYLGGGSAETGLALALDSSGNAYVAGSTNSADFPVTASAYQRSFGGGTGKSDAFIAKLNTTGTALTYATYLGGAESDAAYGVAVDSSGNAYVTGETGFVASGTNFPITAGALQANFGGGAPAIDAFVTKLNANGSALVYSTFFGGNGTDRGAAIALDAASNAYVTGWTASTNLTAAAGGLGVYGDNVDAFVLGLNAAGAALTYISYLGGGNNDEGAAIALSNTNEIYVTGTTESAAFPVTPGTLRPRNARVQEAFITRIGPNGAMPVTSVSAASYSGPRLAEESIVAAFGVKLATQTAIGGDVDTGTPGIQLPTTLAGTQLVLRDSAGVERAVPLFFVSPEQINYQIPSGLAAGTALATVHSGDGSITLGSVQIVRVAPGVFTSNGNGQGVPAGFAIRVRADNSQSFEPIAELDAQNRWVPRPLDLGPSTDRVFLILFGTGWRFRNDAGVIVQIGGIAAQADFAGAQGDLVGLDQANILLPRSLAGRGRVNVALSTNGIAANSVALEIR